MAGQIGTSAVGAQFATDNNGGGNSIFSLDTVIQSRAVSLTGMSRQMSYWSDPFMTVPGAAGSLWRNLNANVAAINNVRGGIVQVFSNASYGNIVVNPFNDYPLTTNPGSWIGTPLSGNLPFYMFVRFQLAPDPGTGGPGGWSTPNCSLIMGLVDSETLGVAGVGVGIGKSFFGAVGGNLLNLVSTTGVDTTVARDFSVWHDMELFTRLGNYWVKIDDREAINCGSIFPGTMVKGMPVVQIMSDAVLQPAVNIDHIAFAVPSNRADLSASPSHPYP